MQILAHRGYWEKVEEKNTLTAIQRAFVTGYGIETDIRDYCGKLVISHNIADDNSPLVETMFAEYKKANCSKVLALNVKADGLQEILITLLEKYDIEKYFLFDMSIPELVVNDRMKLHYYTRHSDIEDCVNYLSADGVWLDCFYDKDWITVDRIKGHINKGKQVCIVSPELHGNEYTDLWRTIKSEDLHKVDNVFLCTDKPKEAMNFFYGEV